VARIAPAEATHSEKAKDRLLRHLRSQPIRNVGRWTREELYEG
jgi:hypothetical protein